MHYPFVSKRDKLKMIILSKQQKWGYGHDRASHSLAENRPNDIGKTNPWNNAVKAINSKLP